MKTTIKFKVSCLFLFLSIISIAQTEKTVPVFKDGEAQIVEGFSDPDKWIRHDLFVETTFDTDGDDKLDRMHVSVTRPEQTENEGLKLPIILCSSPPYYAGTATGAEEGLFWNVNHELGEKLQNALILK